jgi:hypothetical protein
MNDYMHRNSGGGGGNISSSYQESYDEDGMMMMMSSGAGQGHSNDDDDDDDNNDSGMLLYTHQMSDDDNYASGMIDGSGNAGGAVVPEINFNDPAIASLPRVLLMGPRRGGKTSMLVCNFCFVCFACWMFANEEISTYFPDYLFCLLTFFRLSLLNSTVIRSNSSKTIDVK